MKKLGVPTIFASVLLGLSALPSAAQTIDPALAKSWAFMQQQMPGASYDMLKAACGEGALTVYHGSWTDAQISIVDHFTQTFPCIKVQRFELTAGPLRERFLSESRANHNVADIVQDTDSGSLDKEVQQGLFMDYKITNDGAFVDAVKHAGYWYPIYFSLVGIGWNTTLVNDKQAALLKDWKGLQDPVWKTFGKGRIGVTDPSNGQTSFLPWYVWQKLYGDDFIQNIGALSPHIFSASNPAAEALASGEVAVLFNTPEAAPLNLFVNGAPIRWSLPEPGIGGAVGQAIPVHAPHPDAAKLYQEYAFTNDGYGYFNKLGGAPARTGFKDQRKVASESWYKAPSNFFAYSTDDATASHERIVALFNKLVGSIH